MKHPMIPGEFVADFERETITTHGWRVAKMHEGGYVAEMEHVNEHGDVWHRARVKYDGCVEYERAFNLPFPQPENDDAALSDQIHICDIPDEIALLQQLHEAAIRLMPLYAAEAGA